MASTHDLEMGAGRVTKRYTDWGRGEHRREWTVLQTLHGAVPDLVPEPLTADLDGVPPWIEMARIVGEPMAGSLTMQQLRALAAALQRMWSVPVGDLPPRRFHPAEAVAVVGSGLAAAPRPSGVAGEAYDLCVAHLADPRTGAWPGNQAVVGQGDANLANFLWDGESVRLVDFEDGGASELEYEIGFLVEHLAGRDTDWTPLLASFELDPERVRDARLISAAHWLLLLLPGGPANRFNPPGTLDRQAERILTLA